MTDVTCTLTDDIRRHRRSAFVHPSMSRVDASPLICDETLTEKKKDFQRIKGFRLFLLFFHLIHPPTNMSYSGYRSRRAHRSFSGSEGPGYGRKGIGTKVCSLSRPFAFSPATPAFIPLRCAEAENASLSLSLSRRTFVSARFPVPSLPGFRECEGIREKEKQDASLHCLPACLPAARDRP